MDKKGQSFLQKAKELVFKSSVFTLTAATIILTVKNVVFAEGKDTVSDNSIEITKNVEPIEIKEDELSNVVVNDLNNNGTIEPNEIEIEIKESSKSNSEIDLDELLQQKSDILKQESENLEEPIIEEELMMTLEGSTEATQKEQVEQFVTDFYKTYLGRIPDSSGLDYWTNQIINGKQTPQQVALGFTSSPEYTKKNKSNEEYVKDMYMSYLGRTPDEAGYKYWVNALNNGTPREEIINGFQNSNEFVKKCTSNEVYHKGTADFVERLYEKVLDRNSDTQGKMYWHNSIIQQNKSTNAYEKALSGFTNSQEFVQKKLSREDYVETLYKTCFDRNSDPNGKAYWLSMIKNYTDIGMSEQEARNAILSGFTGSTEFQEMIINAQLGRDKTGLIPPTEKDKKKETEEEEQERVRREHEKYY